MGAWTSESATHVASMNGGDFKSNEQSSTIQKEGWVEISHTNEAGTKINLKNRVEVLQGEIIDGTCLSVNALLTFLEQEIQDAKSKGLLFSLHMKATMMKVSDPIIF